MILFVFVNPVAIPLFQRTVLLQFIVQNEYMHSLNNRTQLIIYQLLTINITIYIFVMKLFSIRSFIKIIIRHAEKKDEKKGRE